MAFTLRYSERTAPRRNLRFFSLARSAVRVKLSENAYGVQTRLRALVTVFPTSLCSSARADGMSGVEKMRDASGPTYPCG